MMPEDAGAAKALRDPLSPLLASHSMPLGIMPKPPTGHDEVFPAKAIMGSEFVTDCSASGTPGRSSESASPLDVASSGTDSWITAHQSVAEVARRLAESNAGEPAKNTLGEILARSQQKNKTMEQMIGDINSPEECPILLPASSPSPTCPDRHSRSPRMKLNNSQQLLKAQEMLLKAQQQLLEAAEQRAKVEEQLHQAQEQRAKVEEQLHRAQEQLLQAQEQRAKVEEQLLQAQEQLHQAQEQRAKVEEQLHQAQEQLLQAQQQRAKVEEQLLQAQEQLLQAQEQLLQAQEQRAKVEEQLLQAQEQRAKVEEQAQEQRAKVEEQLLQAQEQQAKVEEALQSFRNDHNKLLLREVQAQLANKIARRCIPGNITPFAARYTTLQRIKTHKLRDTTYIQQLMEAYPDLEDGIQALKDLATGVAHPERVRVEPNEDGLVTFEFLGSLVESHFCGSSELQCVQQVLECLQMLSAELGEAPFVNTKNP